MLLQHLLLNARANQTCELTSMEMEAMGNGLEATLHCSSYRWEPKGFVPAGHVAPSKIPGACTSARACHWHLARRAGDFIGIPFLLGQGLKALQLVVGRCDVVRCQACCLDPAHVFVDLACGHLGLGGYLDRGGA